MSGTSQVFGNPLSCFSGLVVLTLVWAELRAQRVDKSLVRVLVMVRQAVSIRVQSVQSEENVKFPHSTSQSFLTLPSSPAVTEGVAAVAEGLGRPHRLPHHVVLALHVVQLVLRRAPSGCHRPT